VLILGLTGNIGCGKSSLSDIFKESDFQIIDADIIARQIFEDRSLLREVFTHFGEDIRNNDGSLDRKALGRIVFNDENKLIELNNLTHPKIKMKILNNIEEAKNSNKKVVIIDAALLIEGGYLTIIDKLIVVTCDKDIQIKRIQDRDNCTKEEAISRINSQMSQEEKNKYADYIINNSGTFEELKIKAKYFMIYMKENWCE
jgi:dephospho-CoA kinase